MSQREYTPQIKKRLKELAQRDIYMKMGPRHTQGNLIGKKFGRLEVIRPVGHDKNRKMIVLTHCDCGGAKIIGLEALKNGVKSCGCLEAERTGGKYGGQIFRALTQMSLRAQATLAPNEAIETIEPDLADESYVQVSQEPIVRKEPKEKEIEDSPEYVALMQKINERAKRSGMDMIRKVYDPRTQVTSSVMDIRSPTHPPTAFELAVKRLMKISDIGESDDK